MAWLIKKGLYIRYNVGYRYEEKYIININKISDRFSTKLKKKP